MTTVLHHQESSSSIHTDQLPIALSPQRIQNLTFEQQSPQLLENSNNRLKLLLKNQEESINDQDSLKSEINRLKDAQRPLLNSQLSYISKIHDQVYNIGRVIDGEELVVESEVFLFDTEELDVEDIMEESLIGIKSIYALVKGMVEKVRDELERRKPKREGVAAKLVNEKEDIESLIVEDEVELGSETNADEKVNKFVVPDDSLENVSISSSRESLQEVTVLRNFVDELWAESSILKGQVVAQEKELGQRKRQIEELEEKERLSNKNVEHLMMHITATEKEITRWKGLAEEGVASGRAVKQILVSQLATLRQELDEAKETIHDLEISKENIINAAMAAKDTGDKSLRLADLRNSILKERLENLSRQVESVSQKDALNHKKKRYTCWPWIWPGLNFGGYDGEMQEQKSNVEELSEPLL